MDCDHAKFNKYFINVVSFYLEICRVKSAQLNLLVAITILIFFFFISEKKKISLRKEFFYNPIRNYSGFLRLTVLCYLALFILRMIQKFRKL